MNKQHYDLLEAAFDYELDNLNELSQKADIPIREKLHRSVLETLARYEFDHNKSDYVYAHYSPSQIFQINTGEIQ